MGSLHLLFCYHHFGQAGLPCASHHYLLISTKTLFPVENVDSPECTLINIACQFLYIFIVHSLYLLLSFYFGKCHRVDLKFSYIQDVLFFLYFIFMILPKISCHLAILSSSVLPNFCAQFIANKPVLTLNTDRPTHPGMEKSNLSKKIHLH